jgi:selenocysteine lyase/cysteine desulfurase
VSTPLPRNEFAVTQRYVYLNHAAAGVLPQSSVRQIERFVAEHAERGVLGTFPYDLQLEGYRERIGAYIGASGNDIALVTNTSAGANLVATALPWSEGDEVLLCDDEFPANVIPWLALRRRGVVLRLLPARPERLTPERLQRELSPKTKVVTLSWVAYADGYRHDVRGLADVAHRAGALLCVDAMQGAGVLPIDVRAFDVDALYAGAPKWLMGLHGTGFVYLAPRLAERCAPAMPGWRSMSDMWDFHNYDQPFADAVMRFEGGTPNVVGALSLAAAIELFERSGPAAIAGHALGLTDRFCDGLVELGAVIHSPRGPECSSAIVTFSIPGSDSIALGKALEEEGIVTTYRNTGIRISPHGYNTAEEMDTVLRSLARRIGAKAPV